MVRFAAGHLTKADRGVPRAKETQGKSNKTRQELSRGQAGLTLAWALPAANTGDLDGPHIRMSDQERSEQTGQTRRGVAVCAAVRAGRACREGPAPCL